MSLNSILFAFFISVFLIKWDKICIRFQFKGPESIVKLFNLGLSCPQGHFTLGKMPPPPLLYIICMSIGCVLLFNCMFLYNR